jgi:hypothetical protein
MTDPSIAAHITATGAITVGAIAGVVALLTSLLTSSTLRKTEREKLEHPRRQQISRFSEPLARSAYDLQSRLYNILRKGFVQAYLANGSARERGYAIDNTVYLIAQNLCWTELARREIQFIDLGKDKQTRRLLRLQDTLYAFWGTDAHSAHLRLFAGEQRALGEALIAEDRPECIGYGHFLKTFTPGKNPLVDALRVEVASGLPQATDRLREVHHALIDLLDLLDPKHLRFPLDRRARA